MSMYEYVLMVVHLLFVFLALTIGYYLVFSNKQTCRELYK
jgi:Tfp pilus assembly protein PilO